MLQGEAMRFFSMPRITYQLRTQANEFDWHSILISLLRGTAAIIVATAHLRAAVYPSLRAVSDAPIWFKLLAFICGFAHQAVLVFFVISGWLVGGSLLNQMREPHAIANYAIDRVTRLWTVLVPTSLLTLLIAFDLDAINPRKLDLSLTNPYSATVFAGNLVGLQGVILPNFGENFALWSLANETWYYLLFPLIVVVFFGRANVTRVTCLALSFVLCYILPASIVGYFLIWLLGVTFSRIRIECGNHVRWSWAVLVVVTSVYFRLKGELDAFEVSTLGQDILCSVLYLVLLSSLQFRASSRSHFVLLLRKLARFLAEFSFTLYVLHVPLIGLLRRLSAGLVGRQVFSPSSAMHTGIFFGMLGILLISAYVSYLLFESKTYLVRNLAKDLAMRRCGLRAGRTTVSTKG
jgi:peptidoglycan/LPS O-acetylase OafA/YrhL